MEKNNTPVDLANVLRARNENGRYDDLIAGCERNDFHDFKTTLDVADPKVYLIDRLSEFPELSDVRQDVTNGAYYDRMDEADKAAMREWAPKSLWPDLGL